MAHRKKPKPDDLLRNVRFVKLTTVHDLPYAEQIQKALRDEGVGAVIINDEKVQSRPPDERADAVAPEGFRLEVPEPLVEKARRILQDILKKEED